MRTSPATYSRKTQKLHKKHSKTENTIKSIQQLVPDKSRNTTATRKVKIFGDLSKKAKEIQDLQSHANQETEFTSNKQVYIQF